MVYCGLEGPSKWQKSTGPACKRVANWCALGCWKKSCRIRVSSYAVFRLDDVQSNHDRVALAFRASSKTVRQPPAIPENFGMTRPTPVADTSAESRAGDVLLLPVALAAFWTLAYQLVLVARWPAQTTVWCFFAIALSSLFLLARLWEKTKAMPGRGYQFHLSQLLLIVLGAACAITVLFVRRPNQDDSYYFHRVLTQLSALDQPIMTRQTLVDMDAAAFSPVHLATSHEMLMGLVGHYLGIDPLYCYQVVGHVFTAFLIPFVLYWCVRRF